MYTATVLTISDRCYEGKREDLAGPAVRALLENAGYLVEYTSTIPDEQDMIEHELIKCADELDVALIVTTGGTGFSVRDVTPEATTAVCTRIIPGIPEAMRAESLKITTRAILARQQAGIRGESLIINLPGSPKAARENLNAVLPALEHGLEMLRGEKRECAI
jgi:molybdenum cofactor synthesis domain-containing protein